MDVSARVYIFLCLSVLSFYRQSSPIYEVMGAHKPYSHLHMRKPFTHIEQCPSLLADAFVLLRPQICPRLVYTHYAKPTTNKRKTSILAPSAHPTHLFPRGRD